MIGKKKMAGQRRNLIYTILVGNADSYLPMFEIMWKSMDVFNPPMKGKNGPQVDFLLIGNQACLEGVSARMEEGSLVVPRFISNVFAMRVRTEDDLHDALLRKLDIVKFSGVASQQQYSLVMYMDCDIIVQGPMADIFDHVANVNLRGKNKNKRLLHVPSENEDFNHPFFGFERYTHQEIGVMLKRGSRPFNNGIFVFDPSPEAGLLEELRELRLFARRNSYLRHRYFDQSFFNDHFNRKALASTRVLCKRVVIFPSPRKIYNPGKVTFVHFAGLQGYERKIERMKRYFAELVSRYGNTSTSWEREAF